MLAIKFLECCTVLLHKFKFHGLERCIELLVCSFYGRCQDESNHREFKKASGAFAVQFNEETRSLEVLVRLNSCFQLLILTVLSIHLENSSVVNGYQQFYFVDLSTVCLSCIISVYSLLIIFFGL